MYRIACSDPREDAQMQELVAKDLHLSWIPAGHWRTRKLLRYQMSIQLLTQRYLVYQKCVGIHKVLHIGDLSPFGGAAAGQNGTWHQFLTRVQSSADCSEGEDIQLTCSCLNSVINELNPTLTVL